MKKYNIEFNGVHYRVVRLYLGFIPIVEREYIDYEGDAEFVPKKFLTFDDAINHVQNKLEQVPKPKRKWKVVWRGHKRV